MYKLGMRIIHMNYLTFHVQINKLRYIVVDYFYTTILNSLYLLITRTIQVFKYTYRSIHIGMPKNNYLIFNWKIVCRWIFCPLTIF